MTIRSRPCFPSRVAELFPDRDGWQAQCARRMEAMNPAPELWLHIVGLGNRQRDAGLKPKLAKKRNGGAQRYVPMLEKKDLSAANAVSSAAAYPEQYRQILGTRTAHHETLKAKLREILTAEVGDMDAVIWNLQTD